MKESRVIVAPGDIGHYEKYHYASAVRAGDFVFCSGVIGADSDPISQEPQDQFTRAFQKLSQVLNAAGCSCADIIEITTFHVDYPANLSVFMRVKDEFLHEPWPAWTAVGVAALSRPGVLVEIKATALLPN